MAGTGETSRSTKVEVRRTWDWNKFRRSGNWYAKDMTIDDLLDEAELLGIDTSRPFTIHSHAHVGYITLTQEPAPSRES